MNTETIVKSLDEYFASILSPTKTTSEGEYISGGVEVRTSRGNVIQGVRPTSAHMNQALAHLLHHDRPDGNEARRIGKLIDAEFKEVMDIGMQVVTPDGELRRTTPSAAMIGSLRRWMKIRSVLMIDQEGSSDAHRKLMANISDQVKAGKLRLAVAHDEQDHGLGDEKSHTRATHHTLTPTPQTTLKPALEA